MVRRLMLAVGLAAACAVGARALAGAGKQPSARLEAFMRRSRLPGVQQRAGSLSLTASAVADSARSAVRQAVATVRSTRGPLDAASGGTSATSGGVIPLDTVPIDELSDWELDLLTTPDA